MGYELNGNGIMFKTVETRIQTDKIRPMFMNADSQIAAFSMRNYFLWFSLAFNAGCINMGAFLACKRFVTHVTGYATYVGEEISMGHTTRTLLMLSIPSFFLIGCMISAWFIDRLKINNQKPHYNIVFFMIFTILLFVSLTGPLGIFGHFGDGSDFFPIYFFLCLLAMASGLQNAMISMATGLLVRTTHLTGLTTDLGVGIVRMYTRVVSKKAHHDELKTTWLRIGSIGAFIAGSVVASFVFRSFEYRGFFLPTFLIAAIAIFSHRRAQT